MCEIIEEEPATQESYFLQTFKKMQNLRKTTTFCDITLQVDDVLIPAHKIVLASCSRYFEGMFSAKLMEEKASVIKLKDVCPQIVSNLIDFAYSGVLLVNNDNLKETLHTADYLQITSAKNKCLHLLQKKIDTHNCVEYKLFAKKHFFNSLESHISTFIRWHISDVVKTNYFRSLEPDKLEELVTDDDIKLPYVECQKAVSEWVAAKPAVRGKYQDRVCRAVDLQVGQKRGQIIKPFYEVSLYKHILIFDREQVRSFIFDLNNKTLCDIRDRPSYEHFASVYHENFIFLICGSNKGNYDGTYYRYDPHSDIWSSDSLPLNQIANPGVCSLNQKIHIIGGRTSNRVYSYDAAADLICRKPALSRDREQPGIAVHGNCIYACGGENCRSAERLDVRMKHWSSIANISETVIGPTSSATLNDNIYCVPINKSNMLYEYDIRAGKWLQLAAVPNGSNGYTTTLGATDDCLYSVNSCGIYKFSKNENKWTTLHTSFMGNYCRPIYIVPEK